MAVGIRNRYRKRYRCGGRGGRAAADAPAGGDVHYTATVVLTEPVPELRWGMTEEVEFMR
jgi:hypothetical protein